MKLSQINHVVRVFVFIALIFAFISSLFLGILRVSASSDTRKPDLQAQVPFQVAVTNGNYDDMNKAWTYEGNWVVVKSISAIGGHTHNSKTINDTSSITINGTNFIFIFTTGPYHGNINVLVDGIKIAVINQHSSKTMYKHQWKSPTLSPGDHILNFIHASGNTVDINMITVSGSTFLQKPTPSASSTPVTATLPVITSPVVSPTLDLSTPTGSLMPATSTPTLVDPIATDTPTLVSTNNPGLVDPNSTLSPSFTPSPTLQNPTSGFTLTPTLVDPTSTDSPSSTPSSSPQVPTASVTQTPTLSPTPGNPTPTGSPTSTISPTPEITPTLMSVTPISIHNYYVDIQIGSDSNPGSQIQPWKTIQKAANSAAVGSSVFVLAGAYPEHVSVNRSLSFQAQGTVTLQGFIVSADKVTIKGFTVINLLDGGVGILVNRSIGCDIENNVVEYSTMGGISLQGLPSNPTATQNCIVKNNVLFRNGQYGLEIMGLNHQVEGNDISETIQHHPCHVGNESWLDADGIRFFGSGHIFKNNKIHDIKFGPPGITNTTCSLANLQNLANDYNNDPHIDGFQTFDGGGDHVAGHDILFDGNWINLISESGIPNAATKGFQVADNAYNLRAVNNIVHAKLIGIFSNSHDISLFNNTFVGVPTDLYSQGIYLNNDTNVKIQNNIFAYQENGAGSIKPDSVSAATLLAGYNCVYRTSGNPNRPKDPGDVWGLDPLFVNAVNLDYHLLATSPCIDKGTNVGVFDDFDGKVRPQGVGFDMGAFEFTP